MKFMTSFHATRCAPRSFEFLLQLCFGILTQFTSTRSDQVFLYPNIERRGHWESQHILTLPLRPPNDCITLVLDNPSTFQVP
jgi:hypothetical protein